MIPCQNIFSNLLHYNDVGNFTLFYCINITVHSQKNDFRELCEQGVVFCFWERDLNLVEKSLIFLPSSPNHITLYNKSIVLEQSAYLFFSLDTYVMLGCILMINKIKDVCFMLMKIGDITGKYGISHRSLHYWEEMGIIKSSRADNDYRYYDEENQQRIKQILVLRKLRLPLKQIIMVLESNNSSEIIDTLEQSLNQIDNEINALSIIRSILNSFISKLNENIKIDIKLDLLDDSTILEIADSLTITRPVLKEEKYYEELNKADENLLKSKEKYIRIIYLPPMTVAEINFYGEEIMPGEEIYMPQNGNPDFEKDGKIIPNHFNAGINAIDKFIIDNKLADIMPDFRLFGFANCSDMENYGPFYGFGRWLKIKEEMDVLFPFVKKQIKGGLYAAYSRPLPMSGGDSDEWEVLNHWIMNNDKYEYAGGFEPNCNFGLLEDYLNYINLYKLPFDQKQVQTDLLLPIKERQK